jgi:cytochrome c-type biogenesis protein CcmH/NrfF
MCGGCPRLTLDSCACGDADNAREAIRARMRSGDTRDEILLGYAKQWGTDAIIVPPNEGAMRAIYAVPLAAIVGGGLGLAVFVRRWRKPTSAAEAPKPSDAKPRDEYDARLDEELKDLDG